MSVASGFNSDIAATLLRPDNSKNAEAVLEAMLVVRYALQNLSAVERSSRPRKRDEAAVSHGSAASATSSNYA